MSTSRSSEKSPVDAVQAIFSALEPLDQETRERVVASALSLLGMPSSARVASTQSSPIQAASSVGVDARHPERALSIVELMQEKTPATNIQKIALFAYYRERYEGQGRFSRSDLKTYFSKAKEAPPGNYDRDFTNAVRQGWIHEDGVESYLTSMGLEAVEGGFAGKAASRGRATRKKGSKKKTANRKSRSKRASKT